ncbi:MAG: L-seryl-tRNA(Sec) selenium transferase [Defluviitaleaceae bacterium]|nr:L-seryl-tRNA(Sec) selenium transferase [Defluviitaleaceae bacterium]
MNNEIYRNLPKVDEILADGRITFFRDAPSCLLPTSTVLNAVRDALNEIRSNLKSETKREILFESVVQATQEKLGELRKNRLQRVINATGIIIHTNLGRAPIPHAAATGLADIITGYTNLEYNITEGRRQTRGTHVEHLICALTGAEDALCVNNNAAAVLISLNTLCNDKDILISRGEIVEIGGSFRLSGIIETSGASMVEVGSTNRTRLFDYMEKLNPTIGALLKVHRSNFSITGYTEEVTAADLVRLGKEHDVPIIEDMGSGVLVDLSKYGLPYERQVKDALSDGVDIATFSGDKLLGGPQMGIIAGKKGLIGKMRKNPLLRCVRPDKTSLYLLEKCLEEYCMPHPQIPALLLAEEDVNLKALSLQTAINTANPTAITEVVDAQAELGGGTTPGSTIKSKAIRVRLHNTSTAKLERRLRNAEIPIICTVSGDFVCLNVMTIDEKDFNYIAKELSEQNEV